MKVVCEAHFLELAIGDYSPTLKKAQGSSVPKAYATQQSCTKELTYNLSRGLAKSGRVIKGYIVLEDEAVSTPKVTPRYGVKRTGTGAYTVTLDELFEENAMYGSKDAGELPF